MCVCVCVCVCVCRVQSTALLRAYSPTQAMAAHWNEHSLLRIAHVIESFTSLRRPAKYFDLLAGATAAN